MDMNRIIGQLFSGFMCKVYACAFAVWIAVEAGSFIARSFAAMSQGLGS